MSEEGGCSVRGSPLYMAPEVLRGAHDARADLWSVGKSPPQHARAVRRVGAGVRGAHTIVPLLYIYVLQV